MIKFEYYRLEMIHNMNRHSVIQVAHMKLEKGTTLDLKKEFIRIRRGLGLKWCTILRCHLTNAPAKYIQCYMAQNEFSHSPICILCMSCIPLKFACNAQTVVQSSRFSMIELAEERTKFLINQHIEWSNYSALLAPSTKLFMVPLRMTPRSASARSNSSSWSLSTRP